MSLVISYLKREVIYDEFNQTIKIAKERLNAPFPHEFSNHQYMFQHPIIDINDFVEKRDEGMLTYSHLGFNKPDLYNAENSETQNTEA